MDKSDYINYWRLTAEKDWEAVGHLFEKGDYLHALFFAHLVLEKLLKAHHVKDNTGDFPPRTHNLLMLCTQTTLSPADNQLRILSQMNQFQMDGRYPDYKMAMFKLATDIYTNTILEEVESVKIWLTSTLP